jgi:hypothetical protein
VEIGPLIAVAVITLVTVAGNSLWPSRRRRINRALASRPRALVHDAHGAVRLTGRIRRIGELLRAPLSGRPCVAYEVLIDEPGRPNGPGAAPWRRRVELRDMSPFLLADESGEARIDPSGPVIMDLNHDRTGGTGGKFPGEHEALASFLSSIDVVATNWLGRWRLFRYVEGVLEEGELVSVSAESVLEVDPTGERAGPRSPPRRLVLRGSEALPLLISDGEEDLSGRPEAPA